MKTVKTISEQIEILQKRGLIINDEEKAYSVLQNINYYSLTGYLFQFKRDKCYLEGTSFDLIYNLYLFDNELRTLLLSQVSNAEEMLKTRISYHIAILHPENPLIYLDKEYFKNKSDFKKLEKAFQKSVQDNQSISFVRHHINHYDAQFPIWVAIELFTLGNLKYLYKNIPSKDRKVISRDLNLSPPVLDSWIDSLRILRNHLAHNMRLYNTTFPKIPKFEKHHSVIIKTNRIFIFFQLLKYISQTVENWNITLIKLKDLMECYSQYISNQSLGLPDNWFYLLK